MDDEDQLARASQVFKEAERVQPVRVEESGKSLKGRG